MLARSSDIARTLFERVDRLENENAELRAQIAALEEESAILAERLRRARAEPRGARAPRPSLARFRSA